MPRTEYTEQLAALRRDVVAMGELVLERYEEALEAREGRDAALAERVIEGDREVNERYLAVERACIDLFALEQPVAGDLRLVASSFKIATDLERVGDLATNLAADAEAPPGESFRRPTSGTSPPRRATCSRTPSTPTRPTTRRPAGRSPSATTTSTRPARPPARRSSRS
jgi:hypothetical protein